MLLAKSTEEISVNDSGCSGLIGKTGFVEVSGTEGVLPAPVQPANKSVAVVNKTAKNFNSFFISKTPLKTKNYNECDLYKKDF